MVEWQIFSYNNDFALVYHIKSSLLLELLCSEANLITSALSNFGISLEKVAIYYSQPAEHSSPSSIISISETVQ